MPSPQLQIGAGYRLSPWSASVISAACTFAHGQRDKRAFGRVPYVTVDTPNTTHPRYKHRL
jgi:hypothetical protein